jgi:predicted nuclease of predicted toxin-antitoxin system
LRFVRALRAVGEDVLAVSEFQRRSVDEHLMALALAENRILITEDKDFGWLAFAANTDSSGIILIRFPASARATLGTAIQQIVTGYG